MKMKKKFILKVMLVSMVLLITFIIITKEVFYQPPRMAIILPKEIIPTKVTIYDHKNDDHLYEAELKELILTSEIVVNKKVSIKKEYINIVESARSRHSYLKGWLRSAGRTMTIYLHHTGDLISNYILTNYNWEPHLLSQFEDYVRSNPGVQVLDVGCNLGVYTLTAAALGSKVVAVDANPDNTARLIQSLLVNGLEENVTVCLNAMSNERKKFIISLNIMNVGGSPVMEAKDSEDSVDTIFMDDLILYFSSDQEVAIKIDIEMKEIDAFKQASKFFEARNVKFVMMEWEHIKVLKDINFILDFFLSRHFHPYDNYRYTPKLKVAEYMSWPYDIFWIK